MSQQKPANPEDQPKPDQSSQNETGQAKGNQNKSSNNNAATCAIAGCGGIVLFLVILLLAVVGGAAYIWYSNMFGVQDYAKMYKKASSGETQSLESLPISDSQRKALKDSGINIDKIEENPEEFKKCVKDKIGVAKMMKIMSTQQISEKDIKQLEPCLK